MKLLETNKGTCFCLYKQNRAACEDTSFGKQINAAVFVSPQTQWTGL